MFYEKTSCLDLEQFPPTSNAIKLHIYCAYLQTYIWYHEAIKSTINIDPELYSFTCDEDENLVPIINDTSLVPITNDTSLVPIINDTSLVPIINDTSQFPTDFPFPCKHNRCKFDMRCPCRLKELACCQYCNCKNNCLNPL